MGSVQPQRALIIAEAANPEWTSVPLVGWNIYRAVAERAETHLVTQVRNREALIRAGLRDGADFTALDTERTARPMHRLGEALRGGRGRGWTTKMVFTALSYYGFEQMVWRRFRGALASGEFDLVHRVTPLSPTVPSIIAGRLARMNVPFVIGPLNGGVPWPRTFRDRQHREKEWLTHLRGAYRLLPGYRATRRHARAIVAGSMHTLGEMPPSAQTRCIYIPENGVDAGDFRNTRPQTGFEPPLRALFLGRLVPYKGADMLLEAAAPFLRAGRMRIDVAGDGPEQPALEVLAKTLGIQDDIAFHGWVAHDRVPGLMARNHVLVLPSVREFGGGVVLEAMACGLPPVVADYAGPAELVTDETGIRVPFTDRDSLIRGLGQAFRRLLDEPDLIARLRAAGLARIDRHFTWSRKAEQIHSVYDWALGRAEKPAFGFLDRPDP